MSILKDAFVAVICPVGLFNKIKFQTAGGMKTTQDGLGICQLKVSTLDKATHVHSL